MSSKNLPAIPTQNYVALRGDMDNVLEMIQVNLGATELTPFTLDRITVPSQGITSWEIPDLDEGSKSEKNLTGIIIHSAPVRAYWQLGLDEGGGATPPDCFSNDLINGHGTPGGDCQNCPMNQWGSDPKGGAGKACAERRFLFMLRPNSYLPVVIQIPPSSLKTLGNYMLRLTGEGTPYYHVITNLTLEKQTGGNFPYSKVVPKLEHRLDESEIEQINAFAAKLRPLMVRSVRTYAETGDFLNE